MSAAETGAVVAQPTDAPERAPAKSRAAPPLGPRVWGVLLRNEWFKTWKRPAFWLTLAFFAFITFVSHGESAFDADNVFALPEAWDQIFSDASTIYMIFASIALIMLASSEFSWRTARQNVIDGLSKTQWFIGKVLLIPILALVFWVVKIGISVGLALFDMAGTTASGPVFPPTVLAASAGLALMYANVGGLALLLSTAIRSAGPAMAAWFFWIAFGEQIFPELIARFLPPAEAVVRYFPFQSAGMLSRFASYDAASYERLLERAREAERTAPELPDLMFAVGVNAAWAIFFIGLAYVLFRRRDL